jgi:hypothetical protein
MNHRIVSSALALAAALATVPAAADPTKEQCIAANDHAQELRQTGKLGAAREQLLVCVAQSCPGPVRADCAQRLDEIAKAMPSVVFEVKDAAGNDVSSARITIDGQPLAGNAGTALEVDPGEHTFVFEAGGLAKVEKKLVLVEGVRGRHEVIRLANTPEAATSAPAPSNEDVSSRSSGPPLLSYVALGVGGAGLVLGVTTGLVAGGKHGDLANVCSDASGTCPASASGDLDSYHTWRTVSTVGYIVGAVGVAGGAVLWLTAPKAQASTTARVWIGPGSAGVAGRF